MSFIFTFFFSSFLFFFFFFFFTFTKKLCYFYSRKNLYFLVLDFVKIFGGDVALYVELPVGWSTSALVLGAAGAAIAYLVEFYREWRSRKSTDNAKGAGL